MARFLPIIVLSLFLSLWGSPSSAQTGGEIDLRAPSEEVIDDYKSDSRFKYNDPDPKAKSLWQRFIEWVNQKIDQFFSNPLVSDILEIFFYITFVIVLIALIRQFVKGDINSAFFTSSPNRSSKLKYQEAGIAPVDLEKLIHEAIGNKEYDEAIVLMFQRALQILDEKELIKWKSDKTNHDYLYEISGHPSKSEFFKLMLVYEYVEYGDFHVRPQDFDLFSGSYSSFKEQVQ